MEKRKNGKSNNNTEHDSNGNNSGHRESAKKRQNGVSEVIKDQIIASDGRIFYPCRFCNKVFPIKKTRTVHIRKCPAKDYILSVEDIPKTQEDDCPEITKQNSKVPPVKYNIPNAKKSSKIDIKQNIVLNKQVDVQEILAKSKSPPIKLTIRRNPSNGTDISNHFTVSNSLVLKEKNESNDEFSTIAKRLESNSVTIFKQPKKINKTNESEPEPEESTETTCKECTKEFGSPLELLRHSRKCHSYPKVMMALSEVKKFYTEKDRSECPICHKPLKTNFRSAFVKHLHTHTNDMRYSCKVCNKKFRRSDHMKAHAKRHIVKDTKKISVKLN